VQVVEVDVVRLQPLERADDRVADVCGGAEPAVRAPAELRREDDPFAARTEDLPEHALAAPTAPVHVGGVEEGDARVEGRLDDRARLREVDPGAEVVAPEPDTRDAKPAPAEVDLLHARTLAAATASQLQLARRRFV
jgi:hypothetical protein